MSFFDYPDVISARRVMLVRSTAVLSGAAVALLAGRDVLAANSSEAAAGDVRILNTALGAEYEAIAAYQVGAESKLLQKPMLDLAIEFQGHHKQHADVLAQTVRKLGGTPVVAKAKYDFPVATLKTQNDVLNFAATLEKARSALISAQFHCLPSAISPRRRRAFLATRPCIGPCCARRSACRRFRSPS